MENLDFTVCKLGKSTIDSPLRNTNFERDDASVVYETDAKKIIEYYKKNGEFLAFEKAGPRKKIFHDPKWTKAAILTAGGICPGLNDVIKGLTLTLKTRYEVPVVYGIKYGFKGLIPSFGFSPIVLTEETVDDIHEASGAYNGLGLIHVMGRDSGFIAAYASLSNSHVNYCLIPEEEFSLTDGDNAVFESLMRRMECRKHAVMIVAEGAGQNLFAKEDRVKDSSGNILHKDIGKHLKEKFIELAKQRGIEMNIRYFDPTYLIRSLPAHGTDAVFCLMLGQNAVHAAMSGLTDIVIGHWNDNFNHVPIAMATSQRKKIDLNGTLWRSVKGFTWKEK